MHLKPRVSSYGNHVSLIKGVIFEQFVKDIH